MSRYSVIATVNKLYPKLYVECTGKVVTLKLMDRIVEQVNVPIEYEYKEFIVKRNFLRRHYISEIGKLTGLKEIFFEYDKHGFLFCIVGQEIFTCTFPEEHRDDYDSQCYLFATYLKKLNGEVTF